MSCGYYNCVCINLWFTWNDTGMAFGSYRNDESFSLLLLHFYSFNSYVSPFTPLGNAQPFSIYLKNFFYTHTMSRMHGQPFTHTGALASTTLFDNVDVNFGVTRGWDNWEDDDQGDLSITGGLGWQLDDSAFSNFRKAQQKKRGREEGAPSAAAATSEAKKPKS